MRQTTTLLFLLLCTLVANSQARLVSHSSNRVSIEINKISDHTLYTSHTITKGNTAYSLAKLYKCSVAQIYSANNLSVDTPLSIGQVLSIPIPSEVIFVDNNHRDFNHYDFVPVHYKVKKKETLYSIAKTQLGQDVRLFMKRNKMSNPSLSIGQPLLLGWLPTVNIPAASLNEDKPAVRIEEVLTKKETPVEDTELLIGPSIVVPEEVDTIQLVVEEVEIPKVAVRRTRGIGIWERDSKVNSMAVVLHHTAKKGSYITLHNPQLNLSTKAKVIGRIPMGTYPSDVTVIMSKKVAESLGALDTRFMVDLTFEEPR